MGKRSNFKRLDKDFYRTFEIRAVEPLIAHLPKEFTYIEPCAGELDLIINLSRLHPKASCVAAYDIEQRHPVIIIRDGLVWNAYPAHDMIITNPPWSRKLLHQLIMIWVNTGKLVWLLFDAAWMHTLQAGPYLKYCMKIVSIPRVKWIPGTKHTGKDDGAWYCFYKYNPLSQPLFYGRN